MEQQSMVRISDRAAATEFTLVVLESVTGTVL